jgi:hypothetical protein
VHGMGSSEGAVRSVDRHTCSPECDERL